MDRREALKVLTALPAATRIVRADPSPRDVIVVELPNDERLSASQAQAVRVQLQQVWPAHRVVVLAGGVRLSFAAGGV
jgi:hypothetical protein